MTDVTRRRIVPQQRGVCVLDLVAGLLLVVATVLSWPGWSVPVSVVIIVCGAALALVGAIGLVSPRLRGR
ncbi:hypothetical protein [Amycolatopsis pigmentata]|uniref:Uncharacterized protein n=1 Tax=Amycolatopsis pigmentata TaxID=450801 RepID=A0ABW5FY92_9PSEU